MTGSRLAILALASWLGSAAAQTDSFEAASLKPSDPSARGSSLDNPGGPRFNARGVTVKQLLTTAYHLQDFQVTGGPSWLASQRYDLIATAGRRATPAQTRQMLRTLLAERFHLTVHQTDKDMAHYELVQTKGGSKMTKAAQQECPDILDPAHPCGGMRVFQRREVTGYAAAPDQLAEALSWLLAEVVLDKTGLSDRYDFSLHFTPEANLGPMSAEKSDIPADPNGASLFSAIQEQLGLKLESRKGPVPILVVDTAEKAAENE